MITIKTAPTTAPAMAAALLGVDVGTGPPCVVVPPVDVFGDVVSVVGSAVVGGSVSTKHITVNKLLCRFY